MSETIPTSDEAPPAPAETPVVATEPETTAAPETPPDPVPEPPAEPPKPRRSDRHIANLTARLAAREAELAEAQRAREAAEALYRSSKPDDAPTPARGETVEQAAARLLAQREYDTARASLVMNGTKEFGEADWNEKTSILHGLGATANHHFMEALVDLPNAARIVAELADDSDTLVSLLRKSPTAMAAQLGRMDARMDQPPTKSVSRAPRPPSSVTTPAVVPEPSIYDENIDMKTWAALWDKRQAAKRRA